MSFVHGGFHDTCLEYEVITAQGKVLHCTPDNENRLVFQMMHGSFGTLGVLSKLKFRLVPAKPFVHVTYASYPTLHAYKAAIWQHYERRDVDFMDGIIHAPDNYVLSLGRFVDAAPYTNRYDWLKVYYQSTARRREDYLRLPDYLFRYDNGVTNVHPKTLLGRLLFGKFMHSAQILRLAERLHLLLPSERPDVIVDLLLPFSRLEAFMDWYRPAIGFFPLWCVPYRVPHRYEWLSPRAFEGVDDELYVDLAIYGLKQPAGRNYYKEIEDALARVKGVKTLISYNYYERDAFWETWNLPNYQAVKAITDPRNLFRDVYSKTCRAARGLEG
jgi:FAD/FMN-containing dehydrogenase